MNEVEKVAWQKLKLLLKTFWEIIRHNKTTAKERVLFGRAIEL
jgi:hypothetical protein